MWQDILNPCIEKFMQTQSYYDICLKHGQEASCFPNSHFNGTSSVAFSSPCPSL